MFRATVAIALVALCMRTPAALAQYVPTTPTTLPISKVEYCYTAACAGTVDDTDDDDGGEADKAGCADYFAYQTRRWMEVTLTNNCATTGCWSFQPKSDSPADIEQANMWMYGPSCGECKDYGSTSGVPVPAVYQT